MNEKGRVEGSIPLTLDLYFINVVQKTEFDNDDRYVGYSTSNMKRTWEVRFACTNYVHLRFRLPQVTLHLLGSESPVVELSLK